MEALDGLGGTGHGSAPDVQSHIVAITRGLYYQVVSIPVADGVATPPRLRIAAPQTSPLCEYLAEPIIGFVDDPELLGGLNDFPRLRMQVELHQSHGQAVRIGIVLVVLSSSLGEQFRGPRLPRPTILEVCADVEERRQRRTIRCRRRWRRRSSLFPAHRPGRDRVPRSHVPVKYGLPSAVRGVGAFRFTLPSCVFGSPKEYEGHCAKAIVAPPERLPWRRHRSKFSSSEIRTRSEQ